MGYKTPSCGIARSCGGCEWLSVPYPVQLTRKREDIEQLFSDVLADPSRYHGRKGHLNTVGMDNPTRFRHKAATPFAPGPKGTLRCGFYAKGTHRIVPCPECLTEAPGAREALNAVARAAHELSLTAYNEDEGCGLLRHAVVRMGWATDECLLTLVTNGPTIKREEKFVDRILKYAPQVTAIAQNVNERQTNAILGKQSRALWGEGVMHDELLGCSFEVGPTSFYQTNPEQTEKLYSLAIKGAKLKSGMRVLDAYCGIGTIGMCASKVAGDIEVVGVEQVEGAVSDAQANARRNGLEQSCSFVCADATAYMRDARHDRKRFDVVLMDPPRAGSTPAFLSGVVALAPKRVVYVSCNPVTQRRDLDVLLAGGYVLESLDVVDMFPHTRHAETVAVLKHR